MAEGEDKTTRRKTYSNSCVFSGRLTKDTSVLDIRRRSLSTSTLFPVIVSGRDGILTTGKQLSSEANGIPTVRRQLSSEGNGVLTVKRQLSSEGNGAPTVKRQLSSEGNGAPTVKRQLSSEGNGVPTVKRQLSSEANGVPIAGKQVEPGADEIQTGGKQLTTEGNGVSTAGKQVSSEAKVIPIVRKQLPSEADARCDSFSYDIRSDGLASSDGSDSFNRSSVSSASTRSEDDTIRALTIEPEDEIKEAFQLCDDDGGGTLTIQQFKKSVQTVGFNPTDGDIHDLIVSNDIQLTARLGYRQYRLLMEKVYQHPAFTDHLTKLGHAIEELYRSLGKGMDDSLTKDEFKQFIQTKGDDPLTNEEFEELYNDLDKVDEAKVTRFELLRLFSSE